MFAYKTVFCVALQVNYNVQFYLKTIIEPSVNNT